MPHAIQVATRFATPHDTARILGVSKSRTEALIKISRRYTDRILKDQASRSGGYRQGQTKIRKQRRRDDRGKEQWTECRHKNPRHQIEEGRSPALRD